MDRMKKLLSGFVCTIIVTITVVWTVKTPMTVCLTFDDDQNAHATVAGPMLERYGWRGSFNIVTGRLEHPRAKGKMTWAQAAELLAHGHEVFPHSYFPDPESKTFSHYNLKNLTDSGNMKEVERQIAGGKQMIEERLGVSPSVFCLPFNTLNNRVAEVIERYGMKPIIVVVEISQHIPA
jgi:peptidoglycan/xylan/chitin deacetylase (PgdA/CDA1 family)